MTVPAYVTPADLESLYSPPVLAELTSLPSGMADEPDPDRLAAVCNGANGMAYGYLSTRYTEASLAVEALPAGLREAFRIHCAAIARYLLDGTQEEVKAKADVAMDFFRYFSSPSLAPAADLTPGVTGKERFGSVAFEVAPPLLSAKQISELFDP